MSPLTIMIAALLGYWTYWDAKRMAVAGRPVRPFSPVGWGVCVALFAIVFGIWYIVARRRVIASTPPQAPPGTW